MASYFPIQPAFWRGDRRTWSLEQKAIAMYLLTCEHRSLEGFYFLPVGYVVTDLKLSTETARGLLTFLEDKGFCAYDDDSEVVLVLKALKIQAPKSERQVDGAVAALAKVPDNRLWPRFLEACDRYAPKLAQKLKESGPPKGPGVDPSDTHTDGYRPGGATDADTDPGGTSYAGARSSTSNSNSTPDAAAARASTREALRIHGELLSLAQRRRLAAPTVEEVQAALDDFPVADRDVAMTDLKNWFSRSKKPVVLMGSYRSCLGRAPEAAVKSVEVTITSPASQEDEARWQKARAALRAAVPESTFDVWIAEARLAGVHDGELVLAVPEEVAVHFQQRFTGLIAEHVGAPVHIVATESEAA